MNVHSPSAKRMPVDFTVIDGYLLAGAFPKARVIAALLAERSPAPAAAPFYRALEMVGDRAADEALVALRLVLAGQPPSDERVRRLRALSNVARAAAKHDRKALVTLRRRNGDAAADLPWDAGTETLHAAARNAYETELSTTSL